MKAALILAFSVWVASVSPAFAQLSLLGLKNNLIQFVLGQISVPGEFEITVEKVEEPGDGATDLVGVKVADSEGVWLTIRRVSLKWRPLRLVTGKIHITDLTTTEVRVHRLPRPAGPAEEPPEEEGDGEIAWPRSPISVRLDNLVLNQVEIAEDVIDGQAVSFDAAGSFRDEGNVQSAALTLERTDKVDATVQLAFERQFEADRLRFDLKAEEGPGGLVASLANLPPDAGASVRIFGSGPIEDWQADLDALVEQRLQANGKIVVRSVQPLSLTTALRVQSEGELRQTIEPVLGPTLNLDADAVVETEGLITLQQLQIRGENAEVSAQGTFDTNTQEMDAEAQATIVAVGEPFLPGARVQNIGFEGRVSGTPNSLTADGRITLAEVAADALQATGVSLNGEVAVAGETIRFDLSGQSETLTADKLDLHQGGVLRFGGEGEMAAGVLTLQTFSVTSPLLSVEADGQVFLDEGRLDLLYRADVLELTPVAAAYGAAAAGTLTGQGTVAGPFDALAVSGGLSLAGLSWQEQEIGNLELNHDATIAETIAAALDLTLRDSPYGPAMVATELALAGNQLELRSLEASALGVDAESIEPLTVDLDTMLASGKLEWQAPDLSQAGNALGTPLQGKASGSAALVRANGQQDIILAVNGANLAAGDARVQRVTLDASLSDVLAEMPKVQARLRATQVAAGGATLTETTARAEGALSSLQLTLQTEGEASDGEPVAAETAMTADLSAAPQRITVSKLSANYADQEARLAQPAVIEVQESGTFIRDLNLRTLGGSVAGNVAMLPASLQGDLQVDFPDLEPLARLADLPVREGSLNVSAEFDTAQSANWRFEVAGLRLAEIDSGEREFAISLLGGWNGREVGLQAQMAGDFGMPATAEISFPLRPGPGLVPTPAPGAPLNGFVRWSGDIQRVWALVPAPDHYVRGEADVDLDIGGTIAEPALAGRANVNDGRYEFLETGTILTDLRIRSSVTEDGSFNLSLDAEDPQGRPVKGVISLDGTELDASITTDKALLVTREDVTARITANIEAKGPVTAPAVEGDVLINRAEVRLVQAMPPEIATLGDVRIKGAPVPRPEPSEDGNITLDISVRAPNDIFVRGRGLDSEWQMDLTVEGTAAKPRVVGSIERIRGQLVLLGKTFEMDSGVIDFNGAVPVNPTLDIALLRSADGIRGGIQVSGTANDPAVDFVSTPSLPEGEVMPRVLFSRSRQSLSAVEALELASGIATLLSGSGGTVDRVRTAVGLDVLRFGSTEEGEAEVTIGQNIAEGVFVGASQPIDGTAPSLNVEVEVLDDVLLESEVKETGGTSIGVKWKYDF